MKYHADSKMIEECYEHERLKLPFQEGRIYLRHTQGFPERPVVLKKIYPTFFLVETLPMKVIKEDDVMTVPYLMCVTSADLVRDITDVLESELQRLLNKETPWQDDIHGTIPWKNRRFRNSGPYCREGSLDV